MLQAVFLMLVLIATLSGGEARAYTNSWAVAVEGGAEAADQLAAKHGFTNLGMVSSFIYRFSIIIDRSTYNYAVIYILLNCMP